MFRRFIERNPMHHITPVTVQLSSVMFVQCPNYPLIPYRHAPIVLRVQNGDLFSRDCCISHSVSDQKQFSILSLSHVPLRFNVSYRREPAKIECRKTVCLMTPDGDYIAARNAHRRLCVATIATMEDRIFLRGITVTEIGYSRGIRLLRWRLKPGFYGGRLLKLPGRVSTIPESHASGSEAVKSVTFPRPCSNLCAKQHVSGLIDL
jgi:hypothetical protein